MKKTMIPIAAAALLAVIPSAAPAARNSPVIYEAGRCIVQHDRRAANALMATLPLDESAADLSRLRGRAAACAAALADAPAMQVRGALAQAMFMRDFGSMRSDPDPRRGFINLNLPVQASPGGSRRSSSTAGAIASRATIPWAPSGCFGPRPPARGIGGDRRAAQLHGGLHAGRLAARGAALGIAQRDRAERLSHGLPLLDRPAEFARGA